MQATGLAGGYECFPKITAVLFYEQFSDKNLFIAACVCYNIKNENFSPVDEIISSLVRLMGKGEKKYAEK